MLKGEYVRGGSYSYVVFKLVVLNTMELFLIMNSYDVMRI